MAANYSVNVFVDHPPGLVNEVFRLFIFGHFPYLQKVIMLLIENQVGRNGAH